MQRLLLFAVISAATLFLFSTPANACSFGSPAFPYIVSATLSPGTISGNESEFAIVTVQVCQPPPPDGADYVEVLIYQSGFSATQGGAIGIGGNCTSNTCTWSGVGSGLVTVQYETNGYNYSEDPNYGTISVGYGPPYIDLPITVLPGGQSQMGCHKQLSSSPTPSCGEPINLLSGNTWVTQHDYALPGLGGGISLDRTWNSQWPTASMSQLPLPGMFGDSWRSTYEERLVLLNNFAVYYSLSGDHWWFSYNTNTQTYSLTNPPDQHATLTYNSVTNQYLLTLKTGETRLFGVYGGVGDLISITDRNNNTTTITYDNFYRISQVQDAGGRIVTFTYADPTSVLLATSAQDATGTIATYTYESGLLSNVTYPDGSQFNFTYDSNNLLLSVTDAQLKVIESHTYDSYRRGLTSSRANGVDSVTVSYPAAGVTTVTDSASNTTTYGSSYIQSARYVASVTGPACASCNPQSTSSYGYDANGNRTSMVDGNGNTITYTTDANSNQTSISTTLANGQIIKPQWTYNNFAEVLTATDPLGNVTTNVYDPRGNLLTTTTPSPDGGTTPASVTTFTYNTNGTLKTIKDPLNNVTTFTYYPTGLINTIKDAKGNVTTYTYDARGNRLTVQDPLNGATKLTTFTYDTMNRVKTITYPGQTSSVTFHYDYRGRRDSVTDQNGNKTTYGYDDADHLTSIIDPQTPTPGVTQYSYDNENNLKTITDANNHQTIFSYFPNRTLQQTQFPSSLVETYLYDGNNNLTTKTDRKNQSIVYAYDALNRLTKKTYPDQSTVTYTYDLNSRLIQVLDTTGTYVFTYDNMNRLTQSSTLYSFLTGSPLTVGYAYDAASNRKTMTDPQNLPTAYTYDVLNRLATLAFNGQTPAFTFGYDSLSRRTSLTRPNGLNTTYGYDPASNLLSVLHKLGSTTLDGATYTYDPANNRKTRTDKRTNVTLTYAYDNLYQLLSAKQGTTTKETYAYDPVGNRLSSLGVSPYVSNTSNELTSTPSATYSYDNDGNTLTKSGGTTYGWDIENRMISAVVPGAGTVTFKYDPFGRRIQKSSTLGTTDYLFDGTSLIEELANSGNVLARYTQSAWMDQPLSELRSGTTSYYEADGLTSITSLSSSTGVLANTYSYDSYGKLTASTGTLPNPFRYTAREFDPETGVYEYRARYYDQGVGRFLSEDPKQFKVGVNFYDYVRNNPANFRDPLGAAPVWGWWCGPNWTGGRFEPYDPTHASLYHPPAGATDTACMHHDICYYECRRDHPCSKKDRAKCMRQCDDILLTEAPYSAIGNIVSAVVWDYNKDPDTGGNAKTCTCSVDN